ncbi:MAG: helix-turn-helix domain-containing protein [Dehalococcoidia bacterium]
MTTQLARQPGATRTETVLAIIEQHLTDPDLTPAVIAARCGISRRSLHLLFSRRGTTVMRHLWRRRLERCYAVLQADIRAERTLMDIALDGGFGSATHFGRQFKSRFGVSPSCFRKQSLSAVQAARRADRVADPPMDSTYGMSQADRRQFAQMPGGGT